MRSPVVNNQRATEGRTAQNPDPVAGMDANLIE